MANIQVGGKLGRNGRNGRIERPFAGVIAGLSVNRVRVLDLAAERDPHVTIKYDVQLVTGVLDRNDLQRMQQVRTTNIQFLLPFIYLNDIYIYCEYADPSLLRFMFCGIYIIDAKVCVKCVNGKEHSLFGFWSYRIVYRLYCFYM